MVPLVGLVGEAAVDSRAEEQLETAAVVGAAAEGSTVEEGLKVDQEVPERVATWETAEA